VREYILVQHWQKLKTEKLADAVRDSYLCGYSQTARVTEK